MKKFLLSLCVTMLSFVGAWAQSPSVTKSVSDDGKTVTYTCEGDVSAMGDVDGWKFDYKVNTSPIFTAKNEASKVTAMSLCLSDNTYYVRGGKHYAPAASVSPLVTKYQLKTDAYKKEGNNYVLVASGTEVTIGDYLLVEESAADMDGKTEDKPVFSNDNVPAGYYLWSTDEWGNSQTPITAGSAYNSSSNLKYYIVNSPDNWHWAPDGIQRTEITSSIDDYLDNATLVASGANVYTKNGDNYELADGKAFDSGINYYNIVTSDFDETNADNATLKQYINAANETYYTLSGETYSPVYNGALFDSETQYYEVDGYEYNEISFDQLKDESYLTSATENYWAQVYAEIKANGYENVIFVSDGSDGNKAVINSNVIRYLLWGNLTTADNNVPNTAIKKLDLGGVECSDLNDKSWMIVDGSNNVQGGYAVANFKIQELTLPLTKAANEDYVVPAGVLQYFAINTNTALKSIVIPNGYTEVAARAFAATREGVFGDTGLSNIEEYTFPPSLKIIGEKAFYYNGALKHINIPNNSITQIWRFAFAGTALESFDFPASLRFIGAGAFDNVQTLKVLDFSSTSLQYIGNSAFYSNTKIEVPSTLTFPPTIEYIGPGAFNFREYGDIYFTGEHKAPTCPVGPIVTGLGNEAKLGTFGNFDMAAWSGNTHMGYNGFVDDARSLGGDHASEGYANRENYQNHKVYFTMLHFPAGVTIEEAKTYKDVTRKYITERNADGSFSYGGTIPFGDEKSDKVTKFADHGATEWDSKSYGSVAPGYEDTYLGAQKIWPSQNQWMRAYTTVANGVEWNGKDEYRAEVDATMLKWMKYDNLQLWDPVTSKYVALNGEYAYTEDYVNDYNAKQDGAWNSETVITPATYYSEQEIIENNENISGTVKPGDPLYYTQAEIDAHNANFPGSKKANDVKEEGHGVIYYTYAEYCDYCNSYNNGAYAWWPNNNSNLTEEQFQALIQSTSGNMNGGPSPIREQAKEATYYSADEARAYNYEHCSEHGIEPWVWDPDNLIQKGTVENWEQADIWNATIPGAWLTTTEKTPAVHPTAQEIKDHNNNLPTAIKWNEETSSYGGAPVEEAFADYIAKIAYQSTRRFVLADDGSRKGEDYPTDIKGHNWWTIVFPFSMTKAEVDEVFGEGTHVCLFSGVDRNAKEGADVKHITLKFQNDVYAHSTPATAYKTNTTTGAHYAEFDKTAAAPGDDDLVIKAFESYMIYPMKDSQDAADFTIKNPKIEQGSPWPTVIKSNTEIENRNTVADWADEDDHTEYRFVGNLLTGLVDATTNEVKSNTIPQYSYIYAKKKNDTKYQFWFYTGTASAWKVNKCVVQATERDGGISDNKNFFGGDTNQVKQVSLFGLDSEEEEATEIENITIVAGEGEDAAIYNISGQRIAAPQKGLYIKNGKKYIAK